MDNLSLQAGTRANPYSVRCLAIVRQPVAVRFNQVINQTPDLLEREFGASVWIEHSGMVDVFAFAGHSGFNRQRLNVDVGLHHCGKMRRQ